MRQRGFFVHSLSLPKHDLQKSPSAARMNRSIESCWCITSYFWSSVMQRVAAIALLFSFCGCGVRTQTDIATNATPAGGQDKAATAATADDVRLSIVNFEGIEQRIADKKGKV